MNELKEGGEMTILVVEDEEDIRRMLMDTLSEEGYSVIGACDGVEAYKCFRNNDIDIGIFDSMMPNMDGVSLMRKIRETSDMPIIFLTARGQEMDKVLALTLGADDYMVKPFSVAELKARISVQVRKVALLNGKHKRKDTLVCGEIKIDIKKAIAYYQEEALKLSAKEYQLLLYFVENQDHILTKKQLYHAVWKEEYVYDDNTIMVHISHLRNKIEVDPKKPKYFITFKGLGYKMVDGSC